MGVTGLWRLIEPAGKPVPVETLENKVLAVDISIWLHQMVKGYQDAKGAPLANAHLVGLFQRLCKLLYFRIKPVFVFDGDFPALKRETINKRQVNKQKYNSESARIKRELTILLTKKTAISSLLGKQISPKKINRPNVVTDEDLFKLPAIPAIPHYEDEESDSEDEESSSSGSIVDLHSVDLESQNFKTLPTKEKYDLLLELKETRKMNSWGKLHELPKKSDNFSDFQMQRLLKRRKVQECLEETEKEMGDAGMSLNELESFLNEEGIDTKIETLPTRRIAYNNSTRYLLINDVKQALSDAKKKKEAEIQATTSKDETSQNIDIFTKKDELEDDLEKAIKMSLECTHEADETGTSKTDDSWTSHMSDGSECTATDSEEEEGCEPPDMTSAKAYIMQYSDLTNKAINDIVLRNKTIIKSNKKSKVDEILEELDFKSSQMVDTGAHLSCSDDECPNTDSDVETMTKDLDSDSEIVDTTQLSVVVVDNPNEKGIMLDSSIELKQSKKMTTRNSQEKNDKNKEESDSNDNYFENVTEQKIDPMSNTANVSNDQIVLVSGSSDNDFEDVPEQTKVKTSKESNDQIVLVSDSSDDDFEDVPEVESKPVVQLTLNVNEDLEDDIFADVFAKQVENTSKITVGQNTESKIKCITQETIEQNDELKKAIMMSLECVKEGKFSDEDNLNIADDKIAKDKVLNTSSNKSFIVSKTVASLNKPLFAESVKQANKTIETDTTKTPDKSKESVPILNEQINNNDEIRSKEQNEELQKAIRMSLECVTEENIPNKPNETIVKEKVTNISNKKISTEQLNNMVDDIQSEEQSLEREKGRLDRIGRNITEQMTKEAQELLQIFGIPYIVAPMEAEAQCAFLESVNLTDGTITDDSDIWLFGGKTVYKNFFNQKKHVLQFLAERIEQSFKLTREQLVLLALLVGSDYTTGIDGVGPVTAMEILASFPFHKRKLTDEAEQARYAQVITGLQDFKKWARGSKRTDNTSLKKKLRNISLTDDFPSVRVVEAYLDPNVEKSEDKLTWGELDITILRDYTKSKFGWSQNKLDEIIKPVLKRTVGRKSQKSMQDYFKKKINFQSLEDQMSKRVKAAVQRIGPELPLEEDCATSEANPTKRKVHKGKEPTPGPSKTKKKRTDDIILKNLSVKVVSEEKDVKSEIDIKINKTDRFQEIIPQREKDKQSLLQNKMKAIELFRRTNIDKKKFTKRKPILPKEKAELSESSDSN